MTQRDRVLKVLHQRGSLGVTPVDFAGPDVIDGGAPIMRLAPRVQELRDRGYAIRTFKKGQVARYVLVPHVEVVEGPVVTTSHSEEVVVSFSDVDGGVAEWSLEAPDDLVWV